MERLRWAGFTFLGQSLITFVTLTLTGIGDDGCDDARGRLCFDGPAERLLASLVIVSPTLVTGVALTSSARIIERRAERRLQLEARGFGLRLTF